ncbi:hypothetical protein GNP89_18285 [Aliivibrio fischeri]|uniref:collagen-like triple helix repeat-containing protein n=1 Tax=Aliivibrio fischeri TaxID=668 RepID=UPI0012D8A92B|nr:collagen-like protein [Aliivibrio fischeri]MUL04116.1 hypothetical protein [Aliivibrio fischeri]
MTNINLTSANRNSRFVNNGDVAPRGVKNTRLERQSRGGVHDGIHSVKHSPEGLQRCNKNKIEKNQNDIKNLEAKKADKQEIANLKNEQGKKISDLVNQVEKQSNRISKQIGDSNQSITQLHTKNTELKSAINQQGNKLESLDTLLNKQKDKLNINESKLDGLTKKQDAQQDALNSQNEKIDNTLKNNKLKNLIMGGGVASAVVLGASALGVALTTKDGVDGQDGVDGEDGAQGPEGPQGPSGPDESAILDDMHDSLNDMASEISQGGLTPSEIDDMQKELDDMQAELDALPDSPEKAEVQEDIDKLNNVLEDLES